MGDGEKHFINWAQGDVFSDIETIPVLSTLDTFDEIEVVGAAIVSQTCDIVQDRPGRDFVQLAAVVTVTNEQWLQIKKGIKPQFAIIPSLSLELKVIDLDLVVTVNKKSLGGLALVKGCRSDKDARELGIAIARHKNRFAFPDEFVRAFGKLRSWIISKINRSSDEGEFVDAIGQIRVSSDNLAQPTFIEIICLVDANCSSIQRAKWSRFLNSIANKVDKNFCANVSARIATSEEVSVQEYAESYRLDFDAMSLSTQFK